MYALTNPRQPHNAKDAEAIRAGRANHAANQNISRAILATFGKPGYAAHVKHLRAEGRWLRAVTTA